MIVLYTRPKARWLPPGLWTRMTIEGEDEGLVANLATAHLLSTCNEVAMEDPDASDTETLNPQESDDDQD